MNLFKNITRGGQVQLHQLRMLKQVLTVSLMISFLTGAGYFGWKVYTLPPFYKKAVTTTLWAEFMLISTPKEKHPQLHQLYTPVKGIAYRRKCLGVLKDPILKKATQATSQTLKDQGVIASQLAALTLFLLLSMWFGVGVNQKRKRHQRGSQVVHWRVLRRLLKRSKKASDLHIGKLPLLKDKETSHLLMTGTTGSGKTTAISSLLPQIRKREDRAIILDVTGDYVAKFYNPETDIILNPLDLRSPYWHPWTDCQTDAHYDLMAESFIQTKSGSKDPFWDNASRMVLKTALRKFDKKKTHTVEALYKFLMTATDKSFETFFKGTEAASFTSKANEKTTQSIRSVLASQIEGLRQLKMPKEEKKGETPPIFFSIRDWIKGGEKKEEQTDGTAQKPQGWLFITTLPDQRETLRPLISAWVDIAINALMTQPQRPKQKLWFVVDELAALQKLPRLQTGLAEARKYGGCFLVGFQTKPQLEDIYGRNAAESMLDLFNTKLFFRCIEPATQLWISRVLGDKEETESQESISYGAHSVRDGVSLSAQTRQKPLVLPSELSHLKDLECYVKYPEDYPCTRIEMEFQKLKPHPATGTIKK